MGTTPDNRALLEQLRIDRSVSDDPQPSGRRKRLLITAAALIAVIVIAGGYFLLGARPVPVKAVAARPIPGGTGASNSVLDATGYVTARREATVSAQITGTLIEVHIEEGDHVKAGQVLARLDDTSQRAVLAQAQAQLLSARALLVQDQAQLAQSRRDEQRAADLVQRKLVSQQSEEQAHTQVETLDAQVDSRRKQIELAAAGVRAAQVQLDYCTIRAPFTGVIIAKAAQVGEIVSPFSAGGGFTRTGIGTIVDMDSLEVEVDVNEAYIGRVQPGQPVESVLNAYPDWKIPSHVIAIIPTADRAKATVKVRIGIDSKDGRIVPDMGVRVSFLEERKTSTAAAAPPPSGVLVPGGALRTEAGETVVYVIEAKHARRRTVTPGGTTGSDRQVLSGLSPGDRVIVDAPPELKDGALVSAAGS